MSLPPGHLPGWGLARMCWEAAKVQAYGWAPDFIPSPWSRHTAIVVPHSASRAYYELIDRASIHLANARFMPAGHCLRVVL